MKILIISALLVSIVSCSSIRNPASSTDHASASLALGNIQATAFKKIENDRTCFDLKMNLKAVSKSEASWKNWDIKAFDKNGKAYVLENSDRTPASSEGGVIMSSQYYYEQYNNSLKTCLNEHTEAITRLEITPHKLPYKTETMTLEWTH